MFFAIFFAFKPYLYGFEHLAKNPALIIESLNSCLIFMGLGISFSTLQDTTKMQNEFSRKVWEDPKKGKIAIGVICGLVALFLIYGISGYFLIENEMVKELSFGAIVMGIGLIGFLKAALEVFENHRKDKNTLLDTV